MEYTVIFPSRPAMKFYLRSVAELYAGIYGGRVVGKPELKWVDKLAA